MNSADIRPYPYPYKAMFTICSDLDETPTSARYFDIVRFLNTEEETPAGKGVGLELGNTIYFDMPDDQFSYWNIDDSGREIVRDLIRSGHIDCFHSFGDLAVTRGHAERALEELDRHSCKIECWVDHASAITNFGSDIMQGTGDIEGSSAYHGDLTYQYGVRFVWRGRATSVIGQNRRRSLRGLFSVAHPLTSSRTIAIEGAKGVLGKRGDTKYAMHGDNDVLRASTLRDGQPVFEFMRCNPYWGGVSEGETADDLGHVLTSSFLDRLIDRRGVCILYTHLGKSNEPTALFNETTISALRRVAEVTCRGELFVSTTRRTLGYVVAAQHVAASVARGELQELVYLDTGAIKEQGIACDLSGVTIYVDDSQNARLFIDGVEFEKVQRNPKDESGRQSIAIPWRPLSFPSASFAGSRQ